MRRFKEILGVSLVIATLGGLVWYLQRPEPGQWSQVGHRHRLEQKLDRVIKLLEEQHGK